MAGIGRHFAAIAGIGLLSSLAGGLSGPTDPISSFFFTCIIFLVALIAYVMGVWLAPLEPQNSRRQKTILTIIAATLVVLSIVAAAIELQRQAPQFTGQSSSAEH